MASWKMDKEAGEGANTNANVMSNTSPRAIDTVKTWTHVFDILEHEIINFLENFSDEVRENHATKLRGITQSELHKIVV
jgi:hypothetical protein